MRKHNTTPSYKRAKHAYGEQPQKEAVHNIRRRTFVYAQVSPMCRRVEHHRCKSRGPIAEGRGAWP